MKLTAFDHAALVAQEALETERFKAFLSRSAGDSMGLLQMHVVHDDARTCCAREPWRTTMLRAMTAMQQPTARTKP